jgi:hypothetical protein
MRRVGTVWAFSWLLRLKIRSQLREGAPPDRSGSLSAAVLVVTTRVCMCSAAINAETPQVPKSAPGSQAPCASMTSAITSRMNPDVPTTVASLPAVLSAKTNAYEPYVAESGPPHRTARKGTVRRTCVA